MLKERFYYTEETYTGNVAALLDSHLNIEALGIVRNHKRNPRVTVCGIWDTKANTMSFGASRCSPKDIFRRKVGAKLAYDRALNEPMLTVDVADKKVSDVFIENAQNIEADILLNVTYPIVL